MIAALEDSAFYGILPGVVFFGAIGLIVGIVYLVRRWIG